MYCSLATREVLSASGRISSRLSATQRPKSRAPRASSNTNTGARCMASPITVHFTPPHRLSTCIPRL